MTGWRERGGEAAIVAFSGPALDYEFVIQLSGNGDFGFPEFIPWSAQQPPARQQPTPHS
jgi:hypothetical protein